MGYTIVIFNFFLASIMTLIVWDNAATYNMILRMQKLRGTKAALGIERGISAKFFLKRFGILPAMLLNTALATAVLTSLFYIWQNDLVTGVMLGCYSTVMLYHSYLDEDLKQIEEIAKKKVKIYEDLGGIIKENRPYN